MKKSDTIKSDMKTEAVIYCRVSSRKQVLEGHGLDAQESNCEKYIEGKGYKLIGVFREEGISGGLIGRPEMENLLKLLRSRPQNNPPVKVIVDDFQRLSRAELSEYLKLKALIVDANGWVESPNFSFEDSIEGEVNEGVMALVSAYQRKANRRAVLQKMKARLEGGYWPFPCRLPGFQMVRDKEHGKILRRREPYASIVAEALRGYASGTFDNQVDVQHFLQMKRINGSKSVHLSVVRRILENSLLYAGWVEYLQWEVVARKGHHDALIPLEAHLKVQERLQGKARAPARKDMDKDFPHRGFLCCGECGKLMTASWSKGRGGQYPYYRCIDSTCSYYEKSINRDKRIEPDFQELLAEVKPVPATVEFNKARLVRNWQKKMMVVEQRQKDIEDEIQDTTQRVDVLVEKAENAINTTATLTYERKIEKLELYRVALEQKLKDLAPEQFDLGTALTIIANFLSNPLETWLEKDLRKQHRLLQMMFSRHLPYHPKTGFGTPKFSLTYAKLIGQPVPQVASSGHSMKYIETLIEHLHYLWLEMATPTGFDFSFPFYQASLSATR
jgi:DNA invertase Pin-like site-specific DNA recombinase